MNGLFKYHPGDQGASVKGKKQHFLNIWANFNFFCSKHYSHTLSE